MSALERFQQLQDLTGVQSLIGQTEDLHLDCKEWPVREDDAQRILAKAISGFANADGGCLVIGMEAKSLKKDDPDVIQSLRPVQDALAVKSKIENLIGNLIEPPLPGVRVLHILEVHGQTSGFVVIYVPATEGLPVRSRKHWNFYIRISAGTFPMEYFQLADMFGRRHKPILSLWHEMGRIQSEHNGAVYEREFLIGIQNSGRGIARFPSLRIPVIPGINRHVYGVDGNGGWGLPLRPTNEGWVLFGGGADHVVYPGAHIAIAKFTHRSQASDRVQAGERVPCQLFREMRFDVEIAAEGIPYQSVAVTLPQDESISLR